jgi:hypothetical protein
LSEAFRKSSALSDSLGMVLGTKRAHADHGDAAMPQQTLLPGGQTSSEDRLEMDLKVLAVDGFQ